MTKTPRLGFEWEIGRSHHHADSVELPAESFPLDGDELDLVGDRSRRLEKEIIDPDFAWFNFQRT